jgi:copper chaperone CopZ
MTRTALPLCLLSSALSLLSLSGCGATQSAKASPGVTTTAADAPIAASSATLIVHGMSCPLCASNVDQQLKEIPGVTAALVDMGSGKVKVAFAKDARVTRKQIEAAVYKSGFTLAEVRIP